MELNDNLLKKVLVMVLAGGQGEILYPLTNDIAKPAVPFGCIYRIIGFTFIDKSIILPDVTQIRKCSLITGHTQRLQLCSKEFRYSE